MKLLILLIVFFSLLFLYLFYMDRRKRKGSVNTTNEKETVPAPSVEVKEVAPDECCGQHAVCEKESLLSTKIKPDYYDDEELDLLAKRDPESYTDEEIAQFQNVLYTMKDYDVAGWLKSLQLRQIELPSMVKEEALMIVSERRSAK